MKSHRARLSSVLSAVLLSSCALHAADRKAPAIKPASQYTAFDSHPNEHVAIAAQPCIETAQCSFLRLPYIQHGFLPVRVIITNDGDTPLSLDEVRIQFISASDDKLPAANDDDLQRRLFSTKSLKGRKIPLPAPLPPITLHDKPIDKQITKDDNDFGFQSTTVNAHSTLAGYLFYDVRELDDPILKGAELYIKRIKTQDAKKELFAFSIPFDKWLAAHPPAKMN